VEKISAESVEKGYAAICGLTTQEAFCMSSDFQNNQTLLMTYLSAVDKEILNQEEREILFYLGAVAWKIMFSESQTKQETNQDRLLNIESSNQKLAESLRNSGIVKFADVVKVLLKDCSQPEVLRYMIAALMDEDNAENSVRDENLGIIITDLKTVIEYLDR
jgi:hypothetical protein